MTRAAFAAFLVLGLSGCGGKRAPLAFRGAPLVLVSIDTLRADHLPAYGYRGVETPAIDALRKDSILFANAWSHAPLTLPSHASVLTGLLPSAHGLRDNLGYTLAPSAETLASVLKRAGYATGGAVSAVVLSGRSGISRGFDFWEDSIEPSEPDLALARVRRPGGETADVLMHWIEAQGERPFLALLHLYEPHAPYEPSEPYRSRYTLPYDGAIAEADAVVGRTLELLKAKGIYDRAVVVLFSDHGEGLGQHGEDEHGLFLYRETLHVPLLIKLPGGARKGTESGALAGLSDLFPTCLAALGVEAPKLPAGPLSLLASGGDGRRVFSETFYPRIHFGWSGLASLTDGRFHYIEAPRPELYDLASDPGETKDLTAAKPDALRALKADMERRERTFVKPSAVDLEDKKKLAALGYVSSGAAEGGPLLDPKDGIEALRRLKEASALMGAGRDAEAARGFELLLRENPRMLDVWESYSRVLYQLGRGEESLAALKRAVGLAPAGSTHFVLSVAELALLLGHVEDAEKNALLAADRGDSGAWDILARTALARRDIARAAELAAKAKAAAPGRREPLVTLARAEAARGNFSRALEYLEEALRLGETRKLRPMRMLQKLRGDLLGSLGRPAEAEEAYRAEIGAFPDEVDARASLALLYGASGRMADARRTLEELVAATPTGAGYDAAARILSILGDRAGAQEWKRREAKLERTGPSR